MSLRTPHNISELTAGWICLSSPPTCLDLHPIVGWSYLLRPPIVQTLTSQYRNVRLFPIAYAFRPRLRIRLTLSRLALLRKPWVFGEEVSHLFYRYSCRHIHFHFVHPTFRLNFNLEWNALLPYLPKQASTASVSNLSPVDFRRGAT